MAFTGPETDEQVFLGPEDDEILDESSLAGSMGTQLRRDFVSSLISRPVQGIGAAVKYLPGGEEAGQAAYELGSDWQRQIEMDEPVSPEMGERFPVKAAGVVGQAAGLAAQTLLSGGMGLPAAGARAVGLGAAGLSGAAQGEELADRYGVTDPLERAVMVYGGGGIEAGTEAFGGFGGKNFTEALLGQMKSAVRPGNVATRFAKTAGSEGLEEIVAGQAQDWMTGGIVEEDPNRPGFALNGAALPPDTFTMENLYNRLEEGALGAIGGAVFAGAEALGSQTPVNEALSLRMQARSVLDELQAKETLTPEEQAQLVQMEAEDQNLGAWLERQGMEAVRPALDQIINDPEAPETERTEAVQYASLIDNLAAVEAAPDVAPEELQAARDAVSNHPLNGTVNRLAKTRQDESIKSTHKERFDRLQKDVDRAFRIHNASKATAQRQQGIPQVTPEMDPLEASLQQSAQDLVETAPQTAAAIETLNTELPTNTADVTQDQTSTTASDTPATAQAAASMGVQPETPKAPESVSDTTLSAQVTDETPTTVQEQPTLPADAAQQAPVATTPASTTSSGAGESVGEIPASRTELTPPTQNQPSRQVPVHVIKGGQLIQESREASTALRDDLIEQKKRYTQLLNCLNS